MKINRNLHTLTQGEYAHLLANYKKFTDFNHLGLFRSILENSRLTLGQQLKIRDAARRVFPGFFGFLPLKDPHTYFALVTLGQELTEGDRHQAWKNIRREQQRILTTKELGHRNIGTYGKHDCGDDTCPLNGLMVRRGARLAESLAEGELHFQTDRDAYAARTKADRRKRHRKLRRRLVEQELLLDAPVATAGG